MIKKIINIIKNKINVSNSYSNFIFLKNNDFLIKKIFEELIEINIIINKYKIKKNCYNRYFFIKEVCDFIYHIILFLIYNKISFFEIEKEILRRTKISGINEKNSR